MKPILFFIFCIYIFTPGITSAADGELELLCRETFSGNGPAVFRYDKTRVKNGVLMMSPGSSVLLECGNIEFYQGKVEVKCIWPSISVPVYCDLPADDDTFTRIVLTSTDVMITFVDGGYTAKGHIRVFHRKIKPANRVTLTAEFGIHSSRITVGVSYEKGGFSTSVAEHSAVCLYPKRGIRVSTEGNGTLRLDSVTLWKNPKGSPQPRFENVPPPADERWDPGRADDWNHTNYEENFLFFRQVDWWDPDFRLLNYLVYILTNAKRVANGLPPLSYAAGLERSAVLHSKAMVRERFFSHYNEKNRELFSPDDRGYAAGIENPRIAENIAAIPIYNRYTYFDIAAHLVNGWMESSGHRRNILSEKALQLGCGVYCARGEGYAFGTQNFQFFEPVRSYVGEGE